MIKTGDIKQELIPHINQWTGSFIRKESDDKVFAKGNFEIDKAKGIIHVYEFSPNETFSTFEDNLKNLSEAGKITKWDNLSYEDELHYQIYVNKDLLEKQIASRKIEATYKISQWLDKSTLSLLDEDSKLKEFTKIVDIVKYFTKYRLDKYDKLKSEIIKDLNRQIDEANILRRFIDLYLSGVIKIDKDTPLESTKIVLDNNKIPHYVLDMPIKKMTKEEYEKLTEKIKGFESELEYIKSKTAKELYLIDLEKLSKEFKAEFPLAKYEVVSDDTRVMV